jgi:hypothetical protein
MHAWRLLASSAAPVCDLAQQAAECAAIICWALRSMAPHPFACLTAEAQCLRPHVGVLVTKTCKDSSSVLADWASRGENRQRTELRFTDAYSLAHGLCTYCHDSLHKADLTGVSVRSHCLQRKPANRSSAAVHQLCSDLQRRHFIIPEGRIVRALTFACIQLAHSLVKAAEQPSASARMHTVAPRLGYTMCCSAGCSCSLGSSMNLPTYAARSTCPAFVRVASACRNFASTCCMFILLYQRCKQANGFSVSISAFADKISRA